MDQHEGEIAALVARAQAGDGAAVGQLFELLQTRVYRFIAFRASDTETAEDLTQTVFLEMIQALPRYRVRKGAKFTTWLFQLARFRLIDHYRKSGRTIPLEDAPEPSHDPLRHHDPIEIRSVEEALRALPENYQTLLLLRFREDLDTDEIARILKTTTINVRVIQFRALRALRRMLNKT